MCQPHMTIAYTSNTVPRTHETVACIQPAVCFGGGVNIIGAAEGEDTIIGFAEVPSQQQSQPVLLQLLAVLRPRWSDLEKTMTSEMESKPSELLLDLDLEKSTISAPRETNIKLKTLLIKIHITHVHIYKNSFICQSSSFSTPRVIILSLWVASRQLLPEAIWPTPANSLLLPFRVSLWKTEPSTPI